MLLSLIARQRVGPQPQRSPQHEALINGLGPEAISLTWPAVVQLVIFLSSSWQLF